MNTQTNEQQKGFTIIEVVLVLAIAGLIFLMVFVALPSLQRGQRDAQRKQDLSRISVQLTNYMSSTRGAIPTQANFGSFVKGYLNGNATGDGGTAGEEYKDPNGTNYTLKANTMPSSTGQIGYYNGKLCPDDGSSDPKSSASRDFALMIKLENQIAPYCIDNKS